VTTTTTATPWDTDLQWRTDVTATDADFLAVPVALAKAALNIVRDDQDVLIEHYIRAATAFGERLRGEHISPKTMTLTASAFPTDGVFELSDVPVRSITSVGYVDENGDDQTYDPGSPAGWVFEPGGRHRKARLSQIPDTDWPASFTQNNAVTVTFEVGYETADDVPADIAQAILVTIGEFYKSPDLSNGDDMTANVLSVAHFWPRRWSNAL
jgi:uncharacterized phiE125 gp8 family phage protein